MIRRDQNPVVSVANLTVAVSGLLLGILLGLAPSAFSQSSCGTETWQGDGSSNTRYDDNDGVYEDNRWYFGGGNDIGRSLACGDYDVDGEDGPDDMGGGSNSGGGSTRDYVWGFNGDDALFGGEGNDSVQAGPGSDTIEDNQGGGDYDYLNGYEGNNDGVDGRDGDINDSVLGGDGSGDRCVVDHTSERAGGCES